MKKYISMCLLFICIFFISSKIYAQSITRSELQDMVVSTAVSYLNNKYYSEYDQKAMDSGALGDVKSSTINWRSFAVSPEMVSRINYFHVDCSTFATIVYYYSLGYDFSDYRDLSTIKYYTFNGSTNKFSSNSLSKSLDNYKTAFMYHGKAMSTTLFKNIGNKFMNDAGKKAGERYTSSKNLVVYHYEVTGSESASKKESEITKVLDTLQPGDIFVYRRYKNISKTDTSGHAMVYVGDLFDNENGFIHSTGSDYVVEGDTLSSIGDDSYSIRYDNMARVRKYMFSSTSPSIAFTILRPINLYCNGDSCEIDTSSINKNTKARVDLMGLRVEQYSKIYNTLINSNLSNDVKDNLWNASKYNSVNNGDVIQYNLYLKNNSKIGFCFGSDGGKYDTQSACEGAGLTWKNSKQNAISYKGITITAKIPDNTSYVSESCNYNCTYDSSTKTLTWKITDSNKLSNGNYRTLTYQVKVNGGSVIKNSGFVVKASSGNQLSMGEMKINVNPSINKINSNVMKGEINKFKTALSNGKITYSSGDDVKYKFDLDNFTSNKVSAYGFVKNIYYNSFGMDIGFLSGSNIKNAIFNSDSSLNFAKKTNTQVSNLTNDNYKKINQMLVKGFYGGRYLRGNSNKDRAGRLRMADLQFGDIIVYYTKSSDKIANTSTIMMYLGTNIDSDLGIAQNDKNSYFVRFTSDNKITLYTNSTSKTSYQYFNELWSKDLFVVLRPTQLLGTTVSYSGGTIFGKNNSVEYSTYKNLKDLTSSKSYTINLEYNKSGYKCDNCKTSYSGGNTFGGWYSDAKYTNQIKNGSNLASNSSHTIYSKWIKETFKLPKATITGYSIEAWYTNSDFTKKAGDVNTDYKIASNITLYAKWKANNYKVKYNANGGSGTMSDSNHVYDTTSSLSINKFTKSGYVFDGWSTSKTGSVIYKDGAGVKNLTSINNGTVNLYAIWRVKEKDEFSIKLTVKNGTADALLKTVKKGSSVTFTLTPNKGYTDGKLTCENGTFSDNKLTISNISKDLSCSVNYTGIKYNVIYNSNGGSGEMSSSSHTYGISKRLSENTFTRKGYNFKGWSLSKGGTVKYEDNENVLNLTTNKNINLYAVWNVQNYKISYNLNGGELENKISSYRITSDDIHLGIPKKEGYRFVGWTSKNSDEKVKDVVIKKGSTGDKVFTAHYELGKFKVVYKSDKYGKITGITEEILEYKESPSGTTKTVNNGYKNLKWAVDKDVKLKDGTVILSGSPISETEIKEIVVSDDLVITAYHYVKKFTVKYNDAKNGNISGIESEEVGYSSNPLGTKVKATRGYKFKTWIANKNVKLKNGKTIKKGKSISDLKSIIVNEDIELTPVFETGTFNISYQSDEHGIITGIENDKKTYPGVISQTNISLLNDNFEFSYWTANVDVNLNNDRKIKKGDPITNEEISLIVADIDMVLTAHHKQTLFNIYYYGYEGITIIDNIKEVVANSKDIQGPSIEKDKDEEIVYVSDIDVVLNDGKTIKAGKAISFDDLKNIQLNQDLNLTIRYKSDVSLFEINSKTIVIIISSLLGLGLIIFIIKKIKNRNNNKNNRGNSHPDNFGGFPKKKKFSLYRDYYN